MTAAPFPIDRIPPAWQPPASPQSVAIAHLVATADVTALELHWIREVTSLRLLHDRMEEMRRQGSVSELLHRIEAAETAAADSIREHQVAVAALRKAELALAQAEDMADRSNRLAQSLQEELLAIRGKNPVA